MEGIQLMMTALILVFVLLLFALSLALYRRQSVTQSHMREELDEIRSVLQKLMTESESGYFDLLQSVENVEKGVRKTAGLVVGRASKDELEAPKQISALDKKHLAVTLQEQGLPLEEIAARLDVPQGELALILRLSRREEGAASP